MGPDASGVRRISAERGRTVLPSRLMNRRTLTVGLLLLAAGACRRDVSISEPIHAAVAPAVPEAPAGKSPASPKLRAWHLDALKTLPSGALFVASIDVGWVLSQTIDYDWGLATPVGDVRALRAELSRLSRKELGIDVLQAKRALAWAAPVEQAWALRIDGPFEGELRHGRPKVVAGVEVRVLAPDVFVALIGGRLVAGNSRGLELELTPASPRLAAEEVRRHAQALGAAGDGAAILSAHPGPLASALPRPYNQLGAAGITVGSDGLGAAAVGSPEALDAIESSVDDARRTGLAAIDGILMELRDDDETFGLLTLLTLLRAKVEDFSRSIPFARKGDTLAVHVGSWAAGYVAMVSMAGVVAVPAFIKYMRRAKTVEAIDALDKIYKASAVYFTTPRVEAKTGAKLPCQFPPSQSLTPDVRGKTCCGGPNDKDGDDRCDVAPERWQTPTWEALGFQMNEPHYFGYEYESSGVGPKARFTASAYADLDCDGVLSTFQRYGYADEDEDGFCTMKGSSAFYKNQETE